MPHTKLQSPLSVRHHGRALGLRTRSRSRWDADQRRKIMVSWQFRHIAIEVELPQIVVVVSGQCGRFTGIHTATTANGDHTVMPALEVTTPRQLDVDIARVGGYVRKNLAGHAGIRKTFPQCAYKGQRCASLVGHNKRIAQCHSGGALAHLLQPPRPIGDRYRERPIK